MLNFNKDKKKKYKNCRKLIKEQVNNIKNWFMKSNPKYKRFIILFLKLIQFLESLILVMNNNNKLKYDLKNNKKDKIKKKNKLSIKSKIRL
jgi:hypothetical protein